MHKRFPAVLAAALAFTCALPAQTPAAAPAFEVASIKPAPPLDPAKIAAGQMHIGMSIDAARVDIGYLSLADLIRVAYRMKPYQVVGPDWMSAQRFDILAKMPEGGSKDQVPEMLQALLAERFKLAIHHENREHSIYALVVGKNGLKMKEAEPEPAAPAAPGAAPAAPAGPGEMVVGSGENQMRLSRNADGKGVTLSGAQVGRMQITQGEAGAMRMEFSRMTMPMLVEMLSRLTDRPVVDMTELKGNYDVSLELAVEDLMNVARASGMMAGMMMPPPGAGREPGRAPADAAADPSGTSVFAAVQKLGLKLDARKAPADTIVVDHLERTPTEN